MVWYVVWCGILYGAVFCILYGVVLCIGYGVVWCMVRYCVWGGIMYDAVWCTMRYGVWLMYGTVLGPYSPFMAKMSSELSLHQITGFQLE